MDQFIVYEKAAATSTGLNTFVYDIENDEVLLPLMSEDDKRVARNENLNVFFDNWQVFSPIMWLAKRHPDINFQALEFKIRKSIGHRKFVDKIARRIGNRDHYCKTCCNCPYRNIDVTGNGGTRYLWEE